MDKSKLFVVCSSLLFLALSALQNVAQNQKRTCDPPLQYENRNQVDPDPFAINDVSGRVIVEVETGAAVREIGPVNGACIGLFSEKGRRLVASTRADDEGVFILKKIRNGRYRLIVRAESLCVANVPLRVTRDRVSKDSKDKKFLIHMRAAAVDTCSYGAYK